MDLPTLWIIAQRELREALRNRWVWFYTVAFIALTLALSKAGLSSAGYAGLGGFGRTAASLVNALLLFIPLTGLSVGASALAADRERGTLLYLMAQPVTRLEVFLGKALGAGLAVIAATSVGFGLAGLALSTAGGGHLYAYLSLVGSTLQLILVSLALGFLISSLTHKASTASGAALLLWLGLVFFGDLGLVGTTLTLRPTPAVLLGMLLVNPLQLFKLSAIYGLRSTLDPLGPVGQYAAYRFGQALPLWLTGLLIAWTLLSFISAYYLFNRRGDL